MHVHASAEDYRILYSIIKHQILTYCDKIGLPKFVSWLCTAQHLPTGHQFNKILPLSLHLTISAPRLFLALWEMQSQRLFITFNVKMGMQELVPQSMSLCLRNMKLFCQMLLWKLTLFPLLSKIQLLSPACLSGLSCKMQLWLVGYLALSKGFSEIQSYHILYFQITLSQGIAIFSRFSQYFIH